MSGIGISTVGLAKFEEMKMKSSSKTRYRCIKYKISDDKKQIEIEEMIERWGDDECSQEEQFNCIAKNLPEDCGRFILWDLKIRNPKSGEFNDKLVFMSWCPDTAPVQSRMIFASSKEALKRKFDGVGVFIDCSDSSDLQYWDVLGRCCK